MFPKTPVNSECGEIPEIFKQRFLPLRERETLSARKGMGIVVAAGQ